MRNARKDLTSGDSLFPVPQAREEKRRWAKRRVREQRSTECNLSHVRHVEGQSFCSIFAPVRLYGIQEIFAFTFWNPGFWNLEFSSRNPESH